MTEAMSEGGEVRDDRPFIFKWITAIARTWGLVTVIIMWAATIDMVGNREKYEYTHWYLLAISPVVMFFECVWLINKCACCKDEGCCCRVWHIFVWVDNWKKTILYLALSIPLFTKGIIAIMALLCGAFLMTCAFLYFLKSFKYSECVRKRKITMTLSYPSISSPKAKLVTTEIQTESSDFHTNTSPGYASVGTTESIQPRQQTPQYEDDRPSEVVVPRVEPQVAEPLHPPRTGSNAQRIGRQEKGFETMMEGGDPAQ